MQVMLQNNIRNNDSDTGNGVNTLYIEQKHANLRR